MAISHRGSVKGQYTEAMQYLNFVIAYASQNYDIINVSHAVSLYLMQPSIAGTSVALALHKSILTHFPAKVS